MVRLRQTKHKSWRKGQSCASNPLTRKHRDATRRGNFILGQSSANWNLTVEALARHEEKQDDEGDVELKEEDGVTVKSGETFAAFSIGGLTDCSNPVFASVKRFWDSPSAQHKQNTVALVQNIATQEDLYYWANTPCVEHKFPKVIKDKGGKQSDTEYFAALITSLESAEEVETITAITFLLSLVIRSVPDVVLKAKFSKLCQVLVSILANHATDGSPGLLRPLLTSLSKILSLQEAVVWSESSTMTTYTGLLSFVVHTKPKVRKCAREAVLLLLKNPPGDMEHHPVSSATTKFCVKQIEEYGGSSQGTVTTLHIIGLLKEILPFLPVQNVKSICECLLKLMTLGNMMVTVNSLQAMYKLLCATPKTSTLSKELNAQLLNALYDYQPSCNDDEPSRAWITTMEKAFINLGRLDQMLCYNHLPRLFTSLMGYHLSDHLALASAAHETLKVLLQDCLRPVAEQVSVDQESISKTGSASPLQKIIKCVESGLQYRYQATWDLILELICILFEVLGKYCQKLLKKLLVSLCDLRGTHQFPYINKLERAVGMAVQTMGPGFVLGAVPLQLNKEIGGPCNFPRSWLLPVMKENIKETELKYFVDVMLPLSANLRSKALSLKEAGQTLESKVYDTLQLQVWALLPGFCTRPTDLCQSFKSVARILGVALTDRPDLRLTVCQSLRLLISKNADSAENKKELSLYAKNYLPILFNLYTAEHKEGEPDKLVLLETLREYLTVTGSQLVARFFSRGMEKLTSTGTDTRTRHLMMDLVIAMTPYVDVKNVKSLYDIVLPWLQATDITQQKKSYRVLEQICSADSDHCQRFVVSNLNELQDILVKALAASNSASKTPRLRCLAHIVRKLENPIQFIKAVIPEVILCTKEVAVKARSSALNLLIECCNAFFQTSGKSRQECLTTFLELLVAGIAGSPHMICATIISVSRVVYEFRNEIPSEILKQLIQGILVCLRSTAREVVKSSLGFFKVIISAMSHADLLPYVQELISGLVTWNEDTRRRFRFNVKVLFERLIRKFGYQTIYKWTPDKHRKLVHNIHKTTQRLKRQRLYARQDRHLKEDIKQPESLQIESYDDLMFGEDEDELPGAKGKRKATIPSRTGESGKGPKAWIREGTEEEPVDFLDPGVVQRVVATDPTKKPKRKTTDDFEISEDGKVIIQDNEDEDHRHEPGYKRKRNLGLQDCNSIVEEDDPSTRKKRRGSLQVNQDAGEHQAVTNKFKRDMCDKTPGVEYKAKKAGGDIKKKGKADPYAYVPLQMSLLNKRKQRKLTGQFKGLVRATKRGAASVRQKKLHGRRK